MEKIISVIVPVYNIERYIGKCLESIVKQTYKDLQIILVDDGSTDGSGRICDEYSRKDSRIQVIHKVNGGLSDARNAGVRMAEGDYVGFVDGDDYIELSMYERLVELCEVFEADIAISNIRQIYKDFIVELPQSQKFQCSGLDAVRYNLYGNRQYHFVNAVWNKLYRREIIKGLEFPVGRNYEDICYTVEAFLRCQKVVCSGENLYNYIVEREESIMNQGVKENHVMDAVLNCEDRTNVLKKCSSEDLLILGYENYLKQILLSFHRIWNSEFICNKSQYVSILLKRLKEICKALSGYSLAYRAIIVYCSLLILPGITDKLIERKLNGIREDAKKNGYH